MSQLIIRADAIKATGISDIIREIEGNADMMQTVRAIGERNGWAIGDTLEAIASHISTTDTDFV